MELISVIKYEGDNQTFVWKHPTEDFNTGSQLIVHESQVAIFLLNGQALDTFGPGRHELATQNLPLLNKLVNLPSDGISPFHAEVYFINLVEQMGIPWGTNSKIQFMEPQFGFPLSIGACGELALAVREPRKLLLKIVGTEAILSQERFKLLHFRQYVGVKKHRSTSESASSTKKPKQGKWSSPHRRQHRGAPSRATPTSRSAASTSLSIWPKMRPSEKFANMGIGPGMMTGAGGPMAQVVGGAVSQAIGEGNGIGRTATVANDSASSSANTTSAANASVRAKFCSECSHRPCHFGPRYRLQP